MNKVHCVSRDYWISYPLQAMSALGQLDRMSFPPGSNFVYVSFE
jgi:hypothetical protein